MAAFGPPLPPPNTRLGRHRQLAPLAGLHVSPICLGGMSIGDQWGKLGLGQMDRESSFKLLDAFYEAGGNFIDVAHNYQDESSEKFLGEWMEAKGIRDQMVIATKYTSNYKLRATDIQQKTSYLGNNIKSLHISWDWSSGVEEVMNGLHNLVAQGKVLYLTPFVVYQGAWSILQRDFERDIIPMARHWQEGMGLAPWNVLAAGKIRTDAEEERRRQTGEKGRTIFASDWVRSEDERKVCLALEKVAKQVGVQSITAVAVAYVMQKTPYVIPIVGGRKVEHLMDNIAALDIALSPEQVKYLEDVLPFKPGLPHEMIGDGTEYTTLFKLFSGVHYDRWPNQEALRPASQ
ncbi:aryl-alcohol dehydrogenase [Fomitopsis schrenkii]|uniref:Aryl-alcohol dehydrogenase n=1 Tax=Fomitopsis schrenkii TaxID=2126942 RepID=S8FTS4_FOMSC|nr:aryl-alcohol dehydrogenase [Fomitopsis schrenkii]